MSKLDELIRHLPELSFQRPGQFAEKHPGFHPGNLKAALLVEPDSVSRISDILRFCNRKGIEVVPQGGLTGLSGAATCGPCQLIINTAKLDRLISIDPLGGVAVVESGVSLQRLEAEANKHGLTCGIDLAARGSATIGGMVATNAGGIEAFRNGIMRHRVLGLEAVLPDGRVLSDLKKVTKANEGYDIKQLFIGSEGTLGIITQVALGLMPNHNDAQNPAKTALVSCDNTAQAVTFFRALHNAANIQLLSAEAMWSDYANTVAQAIDLPHVLDFDPPSRRPMPSSPVYVLIDVIDTNRDNPIFESLLMELIEQDQVTNALITKNQKERDDLWRIREDSFVVDDLYPHGYWYDMSVPLANMSDYVATLSKRLTDISADLRLFLFAHLGDGNFHATISSGYPIDELQADIDKAVYEGLDEMGGSFSAEHGIGTDKRSSLKRYAPDLNLELMRGIKTLFDPNGIMNPRKVL